MKHIEPSDFCCNFPMTPKWALQQKRDFPKNV